MLAEDKMYRSFASFRMTAIRFVVILNESKDLYDALPDAAVLIPQLSVMGQYILGELELRFFVKDVNGHLAAVSRGAFAGRERR